MWTCIHKTLPYRDSLKVGQGLETVEWLESLTIGVNRHNKSWTWISLYFLFHGLRTECITISPNAKTAIGNTKHFLFNVWAKLFYLTALYLTPTPMVKQAGNEFHSSNERYFILVHCIVVKNDQYCQYNYKYSGLPWDESETSWIRSYLFSRRN